MSVLCRLCPCGGVTRREQEAIEDEEDKANDIYVERAKNLLEKKSAPAAARKTDDDYDEYDEDEEAGARL